MSIFAERLKKAMQQAQITSAQLAKTTGIGRSSISQWLSSKYVAKHDKVVTLAQALDVEPEWLLGATVPAAAAPAVAATPAIAPELAILWEQLDATGHKKLLKKARKLVAKAEVPTGKKKGKKKKKHQA
ncbi:helix-turn-helix domain-containing protein [Lactiplantibacillus sp. WILCCON 0030]|uniref:Helix-turn-helix domain-containing protein n=1 Tax=Lactiplantibacillus brownii TaxID=3069269 RepID=A0ABU1AD00_9LACO|nr:helix-turn-helix domain-containing protein [Lactiplantibacillus brownii]MDQ7938716.1 helix-turn-helix domain-containing protein [Lactiplantibacillus brownii]